MLQKDAASRAARCAQPAKRECCACLHACSHVRLGRVLHGVVEVRCDVIADEESEERACDLEREHHPAECSLVLRSDHHEREVDEVVVGRDGLELIRRGVVTGQSVTRADDPPDLKDLRQAVEEVDDLRNEEQQESFAGRHAKRK